MKLKRLLTFILIILSVFVLAACTKTENPTTETPSQPPEDTQNIVYDFQTLRQAFEKTSSLSGYTIRQTTSVFINMLGMQFSSTIAGTITQNYENEKHTMQADRIENIIGSDTRTSTYYVDGTLYIDDGAAKTKMSLSEDEFIRLYSNVIILFEENSLSSLDIQTINDGNIKFSASVSDSELSAYMKNALGASDTDKVECTKATVYYIISNNGYITEQGLRFNMSVEKDGIRSSVKVEQVYVYVNPGRVVKIEFPDFAEYIPASY